MNTSRVAARSARPSNSKRNLASAVAHVAVGVLALAGVRQAMADDLYWDMNGVTAGAGIGGVANGTWDGSTANWTTDSTGSSATTSWIDGSRPVFSAGTDATGTSSVVISGQWNPAGLLVEEGSITANGGQLFLLDPNINVASGASFTIGSDNDVNTFIYATTGNVIKSGGGTMTVVGVASNLGSSLAVNAGTFEAGTNNTGSFMIMPGTATVASGATLNFRDGVGGTAFVATTGIATANVGAYGGSITGAGNVGFINPSYNISSYQVTSSLAYTGATNLVRSTLALTGSGQLAGTSSVSVNPASTLALDNTAGNNTNRINDSAKINLNGGVLLLNGDGSNNATETVGELHLGTGAQNYLYLEAAKRTTAALGTTLTVSSLTRDPGATMLLAGNVIGTNNATNVNGTNLKITNTTGLLVGTGAVGTNTRGIIPGVYVENQTAGTQVAGNGASTALIGNNATLATYDTNGVRQLTSGEYATALTANTNVAPGGALTASSNVAVNAIEFGGAGSVAATAGRTITVNSGVTLTVNSGTILSNSTSASAITGGGTLSAGAGGASPLYIHDTTAFNLGTATANSLTINASSLTKTGQGTLALGAGVTVNNTGLTYVNQGVLQVNANNQLGTGVVLGNNGLAINYAITGLYGGELQLQNSVSYNIPLTISGGYDTNTNGSIIGSLKSSTGNNTWSGNITLVGAGQNAGDRLQQTIIADSGSNLTLSGAINTAASGGAATGVVFGGSGSIVLTGNSPNNLSGILRQNGATVVIEKDAALGNGGDSLFQSFIQNGNTLNTLAFRAPTGSPGLNYTQNQWLFLNGAGDPAGSTSLGQGNLGLLASIGGVNTFAGHLAFGRSGSGSSTVGPVGLNQITVTTGSLELSGAMYAGPQGSSPSYASIIDKQGTGELIISANNGYASTPNPFGIANWTADWGTGSAIKIDAGAIRLRSSDPTGGNVPNGINNIVTNTGAALIWDDSLAQNTNRNANAQIDLNGGELQYVGSASSALTAAPQNVKISGGSTVSVIAPGSFSTTLDLTGADRTYNNSRGTLLVRGLSSTAHVKLPGSPVGGGATSGTTQSIVPWVIGDSSLTGSGTDFVTVDGSGNARVLTASEYASGITSGTSNLNNANVSAPTTISANTQVNSIKLTGTGGVAISSGTLTVNSGAIFNASGAASSITGGTLAFNNEGVITTPTGGDMTISSAITGGGGLTKSGAGNLVLSGANQFSGPVTVSQGTLMPANDAALGQAGNPVFLAGGNVTFSGTNTFTSSRNFTLNSFGNAFWLGNTGTVDFGATTATSSGTFTGVGNFNINVGSGSLTLSGGKVNSGSGAFTYNVGTGGNMTIAAGETTTLSNSAYLTINMAPNSTASFNGDFAGQASGVFVIGAGANATFGGTFSTGNVLAANISGTATVTGHWNHPGSLVKNNTGTLILSTANTYTGATTINAGTISITDTSALGAATAALTLAGGTIQLAQDGMALSKPVGLTTTATNKGTIDVPAGVTAYYDNDAASTATNIISGSGILVKSGAGTLKLGNQGTQNSYSGGTQIVGGVLEYIGNTAGNGTNGLGSNTAVSAGYWQISNGATLRFNEPAASASSYGNTNRTIAVGTGGGTVEVTALTASQPNAGLLGSTTLTKAGPGALLLTTNNSSFSGKVAVTGGTLGLSADNNLGTSNAADSISLADATTLQATAAVSLGATRGITLTSGVPTIQAANNIALSIAGPISGTGATGVNFASSGTGSITINGNNTYTAATNVTSGNLTIGSSFVSSSALNVADGSSAQLASAAGGNTLRFGTVNTNSSGKLDMTNGRLVLTGSTAPALRGLLLTGYNAGTWTGAGIDSSTAAADANHLTGIGYLTAGDLGTTSWGTATGLAPSALVTKLTYFGDINLDGTVNRDDYALLDRGFAQYNDGSGRIAANQATWLNGDFNYDGKVDATDYFLADNAFGHLGGVLSPEFLAQREAQFGDAYVSQLLAAVPEPTSLGIIGLGALGMLARRRRHQS